MLLLLLVLVAYSALCVSGSVLFLALFPPCPILQSVDQVTVTVCALHLSQLLHLSLHHPPAHIYATPTPPIAISLKPPNRYTHARTCSEAATDVRANMPQHYREMVVIVVSQEPVTVQGHQVYK